MKCFHIWRLKGIFNSTGVRRFLLHKFMFQLQFHFLLRVEIPVNWIKELFHLALTLDQLWWTFNRDKVSDNWDILKMCKVVYSNSLSVIKCVKITFLLRDFQRDKIHFRETTVMFQVLSASVNEKKRTPVNSRCFTRRALFDQRLLGEDCTETSTRKQLPLQVKQGLEFISLWAC